MKTIIFKHRCSDDDLKTLKILQHQGSIDFRKCYNNLELLDDKLFKDSLNIKSSKFKEYLKKEVISFYERYVSSKERILGKINALSNKKLNEQEFKKLIFLKKSYKSKIVFGGKVNILRRNKNLITNEEFKKCRLYPLTIYGETSRKGNRFFNFKDISNGKILFNLESTKTKIELSISNKKHLKELKLLQQLSVDKKIPISVKLTYDKIYLSYDESILYNSNFDIRLLTKSAPIDKLERKIYWKNAYRNHDELLKEGKLERYLSIDLNPNQIGFVITDKNLNILDKGCFEIENKVSSNKRKYEYSIIIKQLFLKINHFKCSYLVMEELENIVKENYGNVISNRKIKNEWKLNYLKDLIRRKCNETKTILINAAAYYSSFIGNLSYNLYDPIASAMELCRRGINKYIKGFKIIPEFNLNNITTDKLLQFKIDYNIDLNYIKNYVELFKSIRNKSYRRKDKTFSSFLLSKNSHVCLFI